MRPTIEPHQQLHPQVKTAELKLADLIQAGDQSQAAAIAGGANGLDALRSALNAQFPGSLLPPGPNAAQQITIGLPQAPAIPGVTKLEPDATKVTPAPQLITLSQIQAIMSALAGVKPEAPKDPLQEVITSQMLLQPTPSLVTSTPTTGTPLVAAVDGGPISFPGAGLALASALSPQQPSGAPNSLKGITLPTGECE